MDQIHCSHFPKHTRLHKNLQFVPRVLNGFFVLSICPIDKIKTSESSSVFALWFFLQPISASFSELLLTCRTKFLAMTVRHCGCLIFLSAALRTTYIHEEVFPFNIVNCVNPVHDSFKLRFASMFQSSSIHHKYGFLATHQESYE